MCCACGGGQDQNSTSSTNNELCFDTDYGLTDVTGKNCAWYNIQESESSNACGVYDTNYFTANRMCCGCGGGTTDINANGVTE